MELNEKLQALRKQRSLTQEELAAVLYVSRTAISKWESGRGTPSIDSLKAIAAFFSVSVDDLLSGDQLLTIAEEDAKRNTSRLRDLVFGQLDVGAVLLLLLPVFGETANESIRTVYKVTVVCIVVFGILSLTLQKCRASFWLRSKRVVSLTLSGVGVLLFILSPQPYAAALLFLFLIIKACLLLHRP